MVEEDAGECVGGGLLPVEALPVEQGVFEVELGLAVLQDVLFHGGDILYWDNSGGRGDRYFIILFRSCIRANINNDYI